MPILVHIGDSNTNGRPSWRMAYEREWLPKGGIFEGWTSYNLGQNGSILSDWATLEIANLSDPAYADLQPADYNGTDPGAGRLARAINADPGVIVLSLGTNDLNSPANRASIGTAANLRANLEALVEKLLEMTHARIILRMPQPFAHEDFLGITQWVDSEEAAEASARLRTVYLAWVGVNQRVTVYDSHKLFGLRCDDKTVDAQDPWGEGALIEDALHPRALGYRRVAQDIARMLAPGYGTPRIAVEPTAIPKDALWAVTLQCRQPALGGGTSAVVEFELSPSHVIAGGQGYVSFAADEDKLTPLADKPLIEAAKFLGRLSAFRELVAVPKKDKLLAYSHATGTTASLSALSIAQIVTNFTPHYAQLNVAAADLAGFGGGPVTFYVTDKSALPFASRHVVSTSMTGAEKIFGVPVLGDTIGGGSAIRKANGNSPVVTVYHQNQADGRYVNGPDNYAAPGKPVGTFTWAAWWQRATFAFDPVNYPAGSITLSATNDVLFAQQTAGTLADLGGGADLYFTT
jgi:lysophospholipase L1-like esterase